MHCKKYNLQTNLAKRYFLDNENDFRLVFKKFVFNLGKIDINNPHYDHSAQNNPY